MAFLLGRGSAVEWLRQNRNAGLLASRCELRSLDLEASRHQLQSHAHHISSLTHPIHLIVGVRENRRPSEEVVSHCLTTPQGSYPAWCIADDLYCSAPEFAFVQMASTLDDEALRFLGMELCGRYGIGADGRPFLRPQTCVPARLQACAEMMVRVRGRRKALAVAPNVWPGSASPMESALALILAATREEGGFGLSTPELNHRLPVTGRARELWSEDFITPDLLWEDAGIAIEYDSDLEHTASHRIARDSSRRNVLNELGLRVISVTAQHMRTPRELERIASIISHAQGLEVGPCDQEEWSRRIGYQLRMRRLAGHPQLLMGLPAGGPEDATADEEAHRAWHVRTPEELRRSYVMSRP